MKLKISKDAANKVLEGLSGESRKFAKLLILDDEPAIVEGIKALMEREYEVFPFTNPEIALEFLRTNSVDLILTDQRMPEMLGTEFLDGVKKINSDNYRMILTGYTDVNDLITCINSGLISRYLLKPWEPDELRAIISQAVAQLTRDRTIKKMIPEQILARLGPQSDIRGGTPGQGSEMECAVMFMDIRGFTAIAQNMTPKEVFRFLTSFMESIGPIIFEHHGFIDKYLGDGVLAVFDRDEVYCQDALNCIDAISAAVATYNRSNRTGPIPEFRKGGIEREQIQVGFGLDAGSVVIGTVGYENRIEFTVLGNTVNTAARIEGFNRLMKTQALVNADLLEQVEKDAVSYRGIGEIQLRDGEVPLNLIEILNIEGAEAAQLKLAYNDDFQEAVIAFQSQDYDCADRLLGKILANNPDDGVADYYLQFIRALPRDTPSH